VAGVLWQVWLEGGLGMVALGRALGRGGLTNVMMMFLPVSKTSIWVRGAPDDPMCVQASAASAGLFPPTDPGSDRPCLDVREGGLGLLIEGYAALDLEVGACAMQVHLLGISYERAVKFHRFLGPYTLATIAGHFACMYFSFPVW
jgi:hypothetical protein